MEILCLGICVYSTRHAKQTQAPGSNHAVPRDMRNFKKTCQRGDRNYDAVATGVRRNHARISLSQTVAKACNSRPRQVFSSLCSSKILHAYGSKFLQSICTVTALLTDTLVSGLYYSRKKILNVVQQTTKTTRGFGTSQVYCFSFARNCNALIARGIIRDITRSNT